MTIQEKIERVSQLVEIKKWQQGIEYWTVSIVYTKSLNTDNYKRFELEMLELEVEKDVLMLKDNKNKLFISSSMGVFVIDSIQDIVVMDIDKLSFTIDFEDCFIKVEEMKQDSQAA